MSDSATARVGELMTPDPIVLDATDTVATAAVFGFLSFARPTDCRAGWRTGHHVSAWCRDAVSTVKRRVDVRWRRWRRPTNAAVPDGAATGTRRSDRAMRPVGGWLMPGTST